DEAFAAVLVEDCPADHFVDGVVPADVLFHDDLAAVGGEQAGGGQTAGRAEVWLRVPEQLRQPSYDVSRHLDRVDGGVVAFGEFVEALLAADPAGGRGHAVPLGWFAIGRAVEGDGDGVE